MSNALEILENMEIQLIAEKYILTEQFILAFKLFKPTDNILSCRKRIIKNKHVIYIIYENDIHERFEVSIFQHTIGIRYIEDNPKQVSIVKRIYMLNLLDTIPIPSDWY